MKAAAYKVRKIRRGQLPSGRMAYLGEVKIPREGILLVASLDQMPGSWFSYGRKENQQ